MLDPIADPQSIHSQLIEIMVGDASAGPEVFRRASELGIFPTVRAWCDARGVDASVSDPGVKRHRIAHVVRRRALSEIVRDMDVSYATLKGIPLARELYGDSSRRSSGDIDLLVERADLNNAIETLASLGYEPASPVDPDANREAELVHADTGLLVDLHWRIAFPWVPAPETSRLIAESTSLRVEGLNVPVLARRDRLIHLFLHFHDHVGFAKGLLDLAAFADVHGIEAFIDVAPRLEELGLLGVASWPLATMQQLGLSVPEPFVSRKALDLWANWTAGALQGVLAEDQSIGARHPLSFKLGEITAGEQVALKAATMALLDRRRDRILAMTQPVASSPRAIARKSGRESPGVVDWARWAVRPAELVMKQIQQMKGDSNGST